ncbi:hypothetical protein EB077_10120, partial [bacterium]|nr:hypothetical protein [bacterium]
FNSIINETVDAIGHILNNKHLIVSNAKTDEYYKLCESLSILINELESAKTGIENLKFTYQNDPNIVTQMDIIILKIQTVLRDTKQKFNLLASHIPNVRNRPFFTLTNPQPETVIDLDPFEPDAN